MVAPRFVNIAILLAALAKFSNAAPVDTGSLESDENSSNSDSKDSDTTSDKSEDEHANSDTKDDTATATAEADRSIQTLTAADTTAATAHSAVETGRSSPVHTEFAGTSLPPTSYYAVPPSYILETTNSEGMTITQYKWWMPESASGVSADKGSTTTATNTEMSTGVSTIAQIYITRSGTKELTITNYLTSSAGTSKTKQSKSTASTSHSTSTAAVKSHYSGAANMNVPAIVGANALVAAAAALLL